MTHRAITIGARKAVLVFSLFMLSAVSCHHGAKLTDRLESMKGHSIDEAVMRWGTPDGSYTLTNGTTAYTWRRPWTSSGVNYAVQGGAAVAFQHVCRITIQTDSAGTILHYHYEDC